MRLTMTVSFLMLSLYLRKRFFTLSSSEAPCSGASLFPVPDESSLRPSRRCVSSCALLMWPVGFALESLLSSALRTLVSDVGSLRPIFSRDDEDLWFSQIIIFSPSLLLLLLLLEMGLVAPSS